ncbi:MAG: FAD-dependent oxidoreductase, partial [Limisphaerales bacterium]
PITAPRDYDPARYELLARYIQALVAKGTPLTLGSFMNISRMPNDKTDINNNGPVSTDFIGQSDSYPESDATTRARIWEAHKNYIQGLFYFLATDTRVPEPVRAETRSYGLCKDEFTDTAGWPFQLYVREARRMVSDYVMTESNCLGAVVAPDSIGLAAYNMDSHNCQRVVVDGAVRNEGDVQISSAAPYPISYRSIVPRSGECQNLLVPWCLSASHMGFGSIRMEPVFLILGQSAGTAACLALDEGRSVQQVDVRALQARLSADKQLLHWAAAAARPVPNRP